MLFVSRESRPKSLVNPVSNQEFGRACSNAILCGHVEMLLYINSGFENRWWLQRESCIQQSHIVALESLKDHQPHYELAPCSWDMLKRNWIDCGNKNARPRTHTNDSRTTHQLRSLTCNLFWCCLVFDVPVPS